MQVHFPKCGFILPYTCTWCRWLAWRLVGHGPTTAFGRVAGWQAYTKICAELLCNIVVNIVMLLHYSRWNWVRDYITRETAAYHYLTSAAKWVINERCNPIGQHSPVQQHKSWYRPVTPLPDQTRQQGHARLPDGIIRKSYIAFLPYLYSTCSQLQSYIY